MELSATRPLGGSRGAAKAAAAATTAAPGGKHKCKKAAAADNGSGSGAEAEGFVADWEATVAEDEVVFEKEEILKVRYCYSRVHIRDMWWVVLRC